MPGRQQEPSFQIASGTTAERDGSYNLTTVGNIFYNTDTSNVQIRHVDPSNSLDWRDLVVNNRVDMDISGANKITFADGSDINSNKFMGFRCRQTTQQVVSLNTLLYYNTTDVDTENKVTQVTSGPAVQTKYTIPKKGWWMFSIEGSSHNSHISPEIQINGAAGQLRASSSSSAFYQAITMGMLECEVDDVITIINKHDSSAHYRVAEAYPQFQGWFLGTS